MSILAAGATADLVLQLGFIAACLAVGVPLAIRWVRPSQVDLPERLPPGGSAWPLAAALGAGLLVWMTVPAVYLNARGLAASSTRPTTRADSPTTAPAPPRDPLVPSPPVAPPDDGLDLSMLPPRDMAFLATVPPLAALAALVAMDRAIYGRRLSVLGLARPQATRGLPAGLLRGLAVVPLVYVASMATEWVYRATGHTHPPEHELLKALGGSSSTAVSVVLVGGAVVLAPVFEELLFRGHVQTLLRRVFVVLLRAPLGSPTVPSVPAIPAVPATDSKRLVWATWLSVFATSVLFASVHPAWTWGPIFLLSLFLGYAYERTGNLWTSVGIHAAFNLVSTTIFLVFGRN